MQETDRKLKSHGLAIWRHYLFNNGNKNELLIIKL
jgi:hypothetical protein